MNKVLENKVSAIMRLLTAEDEESYKNAKEEIRGLMNSDSSASICCDATENIVRDALLDLGVPEHVKGHPFLVRAVILGMDRDYLDGVTKKLYPQIAEEFGTTSSRVERAIRHAIELCWDRGDFDVLMKYFGNTVNPNKGKPTNSEFIARMAGVVKRLAESAA